MPSTHLTNASDKQILQAIVDNMIDSWREVTRVFGGKDPLELFDIRGYITEIPYMMMNGLFDGPSDYTEEKLVELIKYYKKNQYPFMWFISPSGMHIAKLLESASIELAKMQVPGMYLDMNTLDKKVLQNKSNKLEIIEVSSESQAETFNKIYMKSFDVDASIIEEMDQINKQFTSLSNSSHFIAYSHSKPVGIASSVYAAGVQGIYHVGTIPEARGKGWGSGLMARCLLDGIERGYQYSILHATPSGHSMYQKLGYKDVFYFKRYLLRPNQVGL